MPPKLYLVRHAEGEHNATRNFTLPDPVLTAKGKTQCSTLQNSFQYHNAIDLVLASPLRRTIQTATLSFGPTLARKDVPFVLLPLLQEVSDMGCDTGQSPNALKQAIPGLFATDDVNFDLNKIDLSNVNEGWNVKTGYYAYTKPAISQRASDLRNWIFQRPETTILAVSHGAFLHFLTEDWDVADPMTGTAYHNCEVRIFDFTSESTSSDAHLVETAESRRTRGKDEPETDPHVLDEMRAVEGKAKTNSP
ncbi:phosphoglycerate mutase-like protein [Melanomma pulvis-pyrius CBS 109.77]|uniref:Phosphoglycerate mutase-like protein n=1 Tax=Melanomma pulvis-pyrius CBS 109.77 TaxID=1314802 RepID=A0A6A6X922_9PLEO|nr:phosphoglycerate mutase-like protein [Melanomma pulvis-pyrius CBS 109.77]